MRWRICLEVILDNFEASNFFQTPKIETVVSKRGQIRSSICIFPLVSQSSNKYSVNFNATYNWKKHRNCAWNSNPRLSTRIVSCATNQVQQATVFCFQNKKEHSWRHQEFKKTSKQASNLLYENSALLCFKSDQFTSVIHALQSIFCKKNNKHDDYIVKVLLPEALIKICMRIYQCGKYSAEEFLLKNNLKTIMQRCPKDSINKVFKNIFNEVAINDFK